MQATVPAGTLTYLLLCVPHVTVCYSGTFVSQFHGAGRRLSCARALSQSFWLMFVTVRRCCSTGGDAGSGVQSALFSLLTIFSPAAAECGLAVLTEQDGRRASGCISIGGKATLRLADAIGWTIPRRRRRRRRRALRHGVLAVPFREGGLPRARPMGRGPMGQARRTSPDSRLPVPIFIDFVANILA